MLYLLCCLALTFSGAWSRKKDNFVTTLNKDGHYQEILVLLNQTGLTQQLLAADNITLFVPTDEAFARLPAQELADLKADPQRLKSVLEYHAVVGTASKVNHAQDKILTSVSNQPIRINFYPFLKKSAAEGVDVVWGDKAVTNGYVQGIDGIMKPPVGNIIDILSSRPDMTNLTSLLTSTGLIDTIKADQNMTVFAPTDAAFANIDPDVIDWLKNNPSSLKQVLLYHTVTDYTLYKLGMRHSMSFPSGGSKQDRIVLIEDFSGNVYVDRAKVLEVDISATNGVIHVIDDVMIPTKVFLQLEHAGVDLG